MPKKYTIDRFEGELAVLLLREDETKQLDIPRNQLPLGAKEGDILFLKLNHDGTVIKAEVLRGETETARNKAEDLLQKLLNKNK